MAESGESNEGRKVAIECLYYSLSVLIGLILGGIGVLVTTSVWLGPHPASEFAMMAAFSTIFGGIAGAILAPIGAGLARAFSKIPWWVGAIIGGLVPVIAISILVYS